MSRFYVFTHDLDFTDGTTVTQQQRVPTRALNPWGPSFRRSIEKAGTAVFNAEHMKNTALFRLTSRCDEIIDTGMNGEIRASTPSHWAALRAAT